jgi:histone deacetylase 6
VQWFDPDNYECTHTKTAVQLACGGAIAGVRAVLEPSSEMDLAFSLVRPPGHHAFKNQPGGFWYFNNVAVAAKVAIEEYGVKRVCIFDWDVHHGDGTQSIFYQDDKVLYISIHRFDKGEYYPHKQDGNPMSTGEDKGEGYSVNVAWNHPSVDTKSTIGDKEYKFVWNNLLYGIIKEFEPEIILISAGFDAAKGDPLGLLQVTPKGYYYMTNMLRSLCKKVVAVLEGGYNLKAIARSAEATVKALLLKEPDFSFEEIDIDSLKPSVVASIARTAKAHIQWKAAKEMIKLIEEL